MADVAEPPVRHPLLSKRTGVLKCCQDSILRRLWKGYEAAAPERLLQVPSPGLIFRLFMTAKVLLSPTAFGVTGAVFDTQGRVLLVRHRYMPGWHFPGGGAGRGEPPEIGVLRELAEEVGLTGGVAEFKGLYTRPAGWATNVIAFYRITGATVNFHPNLEVCEICFADPANPPEGTSAATLRRLAELTGATDVSPWW